MRHGAPVNVSCPDVRRDKVPLAKRDKCPFRVVSVRMGNLGRVNAEQPDLGAANDDRIAIDDPGTALNFRRIVRVRVRIRLVTVFKRGWLRTIHVALARRIVSALMVIGVWARPLCIYARSETAKDGNGNAGAKEKDKYFHCAESLF